jgi:[ribosomal protein S18]-alanine N-acetyltransferase
VSCAITPLAAGAAEPLAMLHAGCFPEDSWDAEALGRILGLSGGFGFLAWQSEIPVGFALARDLGGEGEILSLGVLPDCRRLGIGRALLRAVIDEAASRELPSIVLEVAEDNAAARGLYASAGFVAAGRRPRYYRRGGETIDALLLRCPVNSEPRPI